ncbi:MAG: DNA replication and repair protein RecF [Flavobacteriaceae bacterium]|nr:DNA replication and repair protein RecF [Flavobacteriaceae bacterium]|tara:strand:- start:6325 stop:7407 length:1083 start_codon:yes stop_codon:yes gene_type:complete
MHIKNLSLTNYKNLSSESFNFSAPINCFVGKNGVGKSNVLDSIYHLAFGKSFFNPKTIQNIQFNKDFFIIEAKFIINSRSEKITCSFKKGQKKILKRNGKIYDKISEHIGLIPLVIISPNDSDLITEGSLVRRKFLDSILGQIHKDYLINLLKYNKVLAQRNSLLKYFALNHTYDQKTISIYNEQLETLGFPIFQKRKEFMEKFVPIFKNRYEALSNSKEKVSLRYFSGLNQNSFSDLFIQSINKDRTLQFTSEGIHKDDLHFLIHNKAIKQFGSQGQKKTYLIALKIAQFDYLKTLKGVSPIVLLDDIFDKLDQGRVTNLIKLMLEENFGQLFLSDTHEKRTLDALNSIKSKFEIFRLN